MNSDDVEEIVTHLTMKVACEHCAERGRVVDFHHFDCPQAAEHSLVALDPRQALEELPELDTSGVDKEAAVGVVCKALCDLSPADRSALFDCPDDVVAEAVEQLVDTGELPPVVLEERDEPEDGRRKVVIAADDKWALRQLVEYTERFDDVELVDYQT